MIQWSQVVLLAAIILRSILDNFNVPPGLRLPGLVNLNCKEIQSVHSTGDQSWVFIGRNDAKAETLKRYLGHLVRRVDSLEKTLMLGGIGSRRRRGRQRDGMAGWDHRLDGREFE